MVTDTVPFHLQKSMEKREDVWGYAGCNAGRSGGIVYERNQKTDSDPGLIRFRNTMHRSYRKICVRQFFSLIRAKQLSEEAMRQDKICKIHIKLDTGMSRIGFR